MRRREFLRTAIVGALASITGFAMAAEEAGKPNFLFVIADDCTHRDIGCYGGQAYTPNIDKLAS
jgi:N-sulfoglucosamine sulfohydrolase